jgi:hypothetical protein
MNSLSKFFAGAVILLAFTELPVVGQTTKPAAPAGKKWTAPKTSWGDPDLQGWLSNRNESNTPLERPDQLAGKRLEDLKGEELARIKKSLRQAESDAFKDGLPHGGDQETFYTDLSAIDRGEQAWLVVDPPDGKIPPLSPAGKDRAATRAAARKTRGPADSWEDFSLGNRCITRGLPGSMIPGNYGNSYQIVQHPGLVTIRYEMTHETRIIPLDGSPHLPLSVRSYMGDPRGHWEGDTLVVETTNFKDESAYRGIANGATLKVTERFQRISPTQIRWSATLEDPQTWTKPWTLSMPLTFDDTQPILEYACHEGNYGLANILRGARAEEKRAAEKAK